MSGMSGSGPNGPEVPQVQQTLSTVVELAGAGLHTGRPARLRLLPAPAGQGIRFRRADLPGSPEVRALWDHVTDTRLSTVIGLEGGPSVATIEHLMAALAGLGVHNVTAVLDGPEVPILDGSSRDFALAILRAGRRGQGEPVQAVRVLRPVEIRQGEAWARLEPAAGFEIVFSIDFDIAAIGRQSLRLDMANGTFVRELADARTFCRLSDVEAMRANGLALGGSTDNAVVFDDARVLTPGGLRHGDEPVRHKMLDALGDLALAGGPLIGRYTGHRAGHALTNALLCKAFAEPGALVAEPCDGPLSRRLPGVGVEVADLRLSA